MKRGLALLLFCLVAGCGDDDGAGRARPDPDAPLVKDILCLSVQFPLGGSAADTARRQVQLDHLEALGVRLVRRDILWHQVEPTPGDFHFEELDPGLAEARARGIELIALLVYGVAWASSHTEDDHHFPPDDPEDYARFAGAVAERYGDHIRRYEIWNEQNNGFRFWMTNPRGDPEAYGALLRAASREIHAVRPEAEVLYGGLFFHEQIANQSALDFLEAHFVAWPDAAGDFDALAFHPYPLYPPAVPPEQDVPPELPMAEMFSSLERLLADHGASSRPIYVTEYGWPSYGEVSREDQAAYLVRGVLWSAARRARSACWYTLEDGRDTGQFPPEDDFGLVSWDTEDAPHGPPKPAYLALKTLSETLGQTAFVRDESASLELAPGAYAFLFASRDGQEHVYVLWTRDPGQTARIRLPLDGSPTAHDATGLPVALEQLQSGVTVQAGPLPVYVVDVIE